MVLPVQELTALCHAAGVKEVFIDGAHSIGQVPIDVRAIDAEYYVSNLHKVRTYAPSQRVRPVRLRHPYARVCIRRWLLLVVPFVRH